MAIGVTQNVVRKNFFCVRGTSALVIFAASLSTSRIQIIKPHPTVCSATPSRKPTSKTPYSAAWLAPRIPTATPSTCLGRCANSTTSPSPRLMLTSTWRRTASTMNISEWKPCLADHQRNWTPVKQRCCQTHWNGHNEPTFTLKHVWDFRLKQTHVRSFLSGAIFVFSEVVS